jgi:hypothetical protein
MLQFCVVLSDCLGMVAEADVFVKTKKTVSTAVITKIMDTMSMVCLCFFMTKALDLR